MGGCPTGRDRAHLLPFAMRRLQPNMQVGPADPAIVSGMRRRVSLRAVTAQVSAAVFCVTAFAGTSAARAASWPTFDQNPARAAWLDHDRSFTRQNVGSL